jgi:group I intron endonuclease
MYGLIYCATNRTDSKKYIGQTIKTLNKRINNHIYDSKKKDYHFCRALKKYGKNGFEWSILQECFNQDQLNEAEIKWIKLYGTCNEEKGYNILPGGQPKLTPEIRHRIALANTGKRHTEESKKKISQANKGRVLSEETKQKIREKAIGRFSSGGGNSFPRSQELKAKLSQLMKLRMTGIPKTQGHREKIAKAHIGLKLSNETKNRIGILARKRFHTDKGINNSRSLLVRCVETGVVFGSTREAERETSIDHSQIIKCCKGVYPSAGKFHWVYER